MNNFIPYEKMSKKQRREIDKMKRGSWNGVNPITRRIESKKAYNRKKVSKTSFDLFRDFFVVYLTRRAEGFILR